MQLIHDVIEANLPPYPDMAIILMSPKLLMASANTIEQMKLINNFCKLLTFKIKK